MLGLKNKGGLQNSQDLGETFCGGYIFPGGFGIPFLALDRTNFQKKNHLQQSVTLFLENNYLNKRPYRQMRIVKYTILCTGVWRQNVYTYETFAHPIQGRISQGGLRPPSELCHFNCNIQLTRIIFHFL